jgi:cobalt transporter subunit CbtB
MLNIPSNLRAATMTTGVETVQNLDKLYAAGALLLGAFLIFGVGFAHADLLHNAAHDGRHSVAFPCH